MLSDSKPLVPWVRSHQLQQSRLIARLLAPEALAIHPSLGMDSRKPILGRRDAPEIFSYMLFADVTDRHIVAVSVANRNSKDAFGQENALRVMPERAVAEIREVGFGFVKPTVNRKIIFGFTTELSDTALCVFEWMSHS